MKFPLTVLQSVQDFSPEERALLTDQILKSPRSVCANLAEAWHRRR
ncbi:four helix bundle protein [Adonisia turfae]|uniref:Four helix bundle protein n=1 Tax=Adonisia turfae CCMR0081 TaxID=2292702 RepID=A0A6M0RY89_9CYAN|nr:four helix bundle protein [Adonisia turfae CCMR0081]